MRASLDHCCTNCTEPCVPMQLHGAASGLLHMSILLASNCSLGQESYWEVWHCFASSFPPSLVKLFPQIREEAASARVFIYKKKKVSFGTCLVFISWTSILLLAVQSTVSTNVEHTTEHVCLISRNVLSTSRSSFCRYR